MVYIRHTCLYCIGATVLTYLQIKRIAAPYIVTVLKSNLVKAVVYRYRVVAFNGKLQLPLYNPWTIHIYIYYMNLGSRFETDHTHTHYIIFIIYLPANVLYILQEKGFLVLDILYIYNMKDLPETITCSIVFYVHK